ncbi:Uu.00g048170.m01.CDS01 [Anthostomella pinea]|uniref:Uu.00g048170.m01.CDS01 n=1 Tax=Anthostomella pinea TaxID=933095 RepID=A0AAI8VBN9_9PEZI|nr:Uu.00g048170.m01.CDS01 [Anthostomella pinea]
MPLSPPDPRKYLPSRAHPDHRSQRKELEKKHPFGYTEPILLGLLGLGLAWNIEHQVKHHEERKDKEEEERLKREDRERRRREKQRGGGGGGGGGSSSRRGDSVGGGSSEMRSDTRDRDRAGSSARGGSGSRDDAREFRSSRHQSVGGQRSDLRYVERQQPPPPRREERHVDDRYEDRYDDRVPLGRGRRDSW